MKLQITLRVAMIGLFVGSVAFGLWADRAHRQRRAVQALREAGLLLTYEYQHDASGRLIQGAKSPLPGLFQRFLGDDYFFNVVSANNPVYRGRFGDADAIHLTALPRMRLLGLSATDITDAGLAHLSRLQHLEDLSLSLNPNITDAGVARLRALRHLRRLRLNGTHVTDASVGGLKDIASLELLEIKPTDLTQGAIEELRRALPNCQIVWGPRIRPQHIPPASPQLPRGDPAAPFGSALVYADEGDGYSPMKRHELNLRSRPGFATWRVDRPLADDEKRRIVQAIHYLRNPKNNWSSRSSAATELGDWGHELAIPALVEILQNLADNLEVRRSCAVALGQIADKQVVPPLIEAVADPDVGLSAREQLCKMARTGWDWGNRPGAPSDPIQWREELRDRWRAWWTENESHVQLQRSSAFPSR